MLSMIRLDACLPDLPATRCQILVGMLARDRRSTTQFSPSSKGLYMMRGRVSERENMDGVRRRTRRGKGECHDDDGDDRRCESV